MKKLLVCLSLVSAFACAQEAKIGANDIIVDNDGNVHLGANIGTVIGDYDASIPAIGLQVAVQGNDPFFGSDVGYYVRGTISCESAKERAAYLNDFNMFMRFKEREILPWVQEHQKSFTASSDQSIQADTQEIVAKAVNDAVAQKVALSMRDFIIKMAPSCP